MNTITEIEPITFLECTSDERKEFCFALRHAIYCELMSFEEENDEKMERDEFDDHARHFIIQIDNVDVGCFRVVQDGTAHIQPFITADCFFEISRFIIEPEHRNPALLSHVVKELTVMIQSAGLMPTCMIMEKKLARFISLHGVKMKRSSPFFKLNGLRAAYFFSEDM